MKKQANEVVRALRQEASSNPVFKDVCTMFAKRQRTRSRLTPGGLKARMEHDGYKYYKKDYYQVLKFLGEQGLGQLKMGSRGRVIALDNVVVRLQGLGKAALAQGQELPKQTFSKRNSYTDVIGATEVVHAKEFIEKGQPEPKPVIPRRSTRSAIYPAFLSVLIDGKLVNFPAPGELTPDNLGEFLMKFKAIVKEV